MTPELLDAYRSGEMDIDTLKAFTVMCDLTRPGVVCRRGSWLAQIPA